jgi:hypothetical protein
MSVRSNILSRALVGFALVIAATACSSESNSSRDRNSALESENGDSKEIDCNAQWDPTTGVMTLCQAFERVDVHQKGSNGANVKTDEAGPMVGNTLGISVQQGVTKLDLKFWSRNPGGELREAGSVEFTADAAATKTFSFKPDEQGEVDRELVFGFDEHVVTQTVNVTGLTAKSKAKFTVSYRLNGASPAQNQLHE